jgi:hypothetical protein
MVIWKSYVDYVIEEYEDSQEDPEVDAVITDNEVRSVCSRAIKFTEFHIPESHKIWNAWMEFELRLLDAQVRSQRRMSSSDNA